jgi:hypothetical protein
MEGFFLLHRASPENAGAESAGAASALPAALFPSLYVLRTAMPVAQALAVGACRCFPVTRVFPGAKARANSYYYLPADK